MLSFFSIFHFGGHCSRQNQKTLPRPSPVREGDASTKDRVPSNVQPHASPPFLPSLEGRSKRSWYTCILKEVAWQTTLLQLKRTQKKSFGSQGGGGRFQRLVRFAWRLGALKNLTNVSVHISEYLRRSSLEAFVLLLSEESIKSEKPACKWSWNVRYSCSFLARGHLLSFLSWCIGDQAYCSQNPC